MNSATTTTANTTTNTTTVGSEFRDDARLPGSGNAAARRVLSPQELAPLTQLSTLRSLLAIAQTMLCLFAGVALGVWVWGTVHAWWALPVVVIWMAVHQHAWFILNHDAAHYRLLPQRSFNDALGAFMGITGGVSMHTYRVTHRLHHNHLYGPQDPDTAIHGGYPRGKAYLLKKLLQDIVGLNAWKTYAYFFGSPAINDETGQGINPLNDTSPQLRQAARRDRMGVVAFHLLVPVALFVIAASADSTGARGYFSYLLSQALWFYLVFWVLPLLTVLQPILRLRAICEHGAVSDLSSPLTAARSNNTRGRWLNWLSRFFLFPHHVNYHLEHHLYPAVPHYHLPRLHALLQAKGALQGAEVRDAPEVMRMIFAPRKIKPT
jgi:fatty acid desaturase